MTPGLAAAALLGALGCSEPSDGTDFIFQNAHRVAGLIVEFDAPSGDHLKFELPANDLPGESYPAAIRFNLNVATGDDITFTAKWNGLTASRTCTVTQNMQPVEGDDTKGWAVVWVQAVGAPDNVIIIECNWDDGSGA
jgi:hypothetical protein